MRLQLPSFSAFHIFYLYLQLPLIFSATVTTLRRNDTVTCVVTGNRTYSPIILNPPVPLVSSTSNIDRFALKWSKDTKWKEVDQADFLLGPVTDKRWEKFQIHSQQIIRLKISKSLTLSICSSEELKFIFSAKNGGAQLYSFQEVSTDPKTILCQWKHYTINISNTSGVDVIRNNIYLRSNNDNSDKSLDITYMTIKGSEESEGGSKELLWNLHKYELLTCSIGPTSTDKNELTATIKHEGALCILLFVAMSKGSCLTIKLESTTSVDEKYIKSENSSSDLIQWHTVQLNITSRESAKLHISGGPDYTGKYWAVDKDNVLSCSQEIEIHNYVLNESNFKHHICEELTEDKNIPNINESQYNFTKVGVLENGLKCNKVFKDSGCAQCRIYPHGKTNGFCAWGYKGLLCNESCPKNNFGIDCGQECSNKCKECNQTLGCVKCESKYFGRKCNQTFHVTDISENCISVKWDDPEGFQVKAYELYYEVNNYLLCPKNHSKEQGNKEQRLAWAMVSSNMATITNLQPFTKYNLQVIAITEDEGAPTVIKPIKTNSSVEISEIEIPLTITFSKNNSINLYLSDCNNFNGELNFTLSLQCLSDWCKGKVLTDNKEITKITFIKIIEIENANVSYFTEYLPLITAKRLTKAISQNYKPITSNPGRPYPVRNLETFNISASSLGLKWKPPYPPTGHISYYGLELSYSYNGTLVHRFNISSNKSCQIDMDLICTNISNLKDNTNYLINIHVINQNVDEIESGRCEINVATDQKRPQAPSDLTLKWRNVTEKTILTWNHPIYVNSRIESFHVEIKSKNKKTKTDNIVAVGNNGKYEYEIDLAEIYNYTISVSAKNNYTGPESTISATIYPPIPQLTLSHPLIEICSNLSCILTVPKFKTGSHDEYILKNKEIVEMDLKTLTEAENHTLKMSCFNNLHHEAEWASVDKKNELNSYTKVHFNGSTGLIISLEKNTYCISTFVDFRSSEDKKVLYIAISSLSVVIILVICAYFIYAYKFKKYPFGANENKSKRNSYTRILKTNPLTICLKNNDNTSDVEQPTVETTELLETDAIYENINSTSRLIRMEELENYLINCLEGGSKENELSRQYHRIPKTFADKPKSAALLTHNKTKNRYVSILPYDGTRVILQENGQRGDYINANFVTGFKTPNGFIATQAPKAQTIVDFWLMVCEQNVNTIVMLTELVENNVIKCKQYWPEELRNVRYGKILVKNIKVETFPNFVSRQFEVTYKDTKRLLNHLQFTTWPDHGVPLYPQSLIPFLRKLLATPQNTPIVVHCNAGCGRTGTVILCDIALRMATEEGTIDFLKILSEIRQQRVNLVNSAEQYIFAHLVVLEYLLRKDYSIPITEDFKNDINKALQQNTTKLVVEELKKVTEFFEKTQQNIHPTLTDDDKLKNRFSSVLPGKTQLFIPSRNGSSYINAIVVDCYRCPKKFVVTQQPLQNTVEDFWILVSEFGIKTIMSLNEIDANDPNCPTFWPKSDEELVMDRITIKTVDKTESEIYDTIQIKIKSETDSENDKIVHIIQMKNWKRETPTPIKVSDLLFVWKEMAKCYWKVESQIIITCYDGRTASGLYTALSFLLEKINMEQICDILFAIRIIKQSKSQFVQEQQQVEFLYKAALEYIGGLEE